MYKNRKNRGGRLSSLRVGDRFTTIYDGIGVIYTISEITNFDIKVSWSGSIVNEYWEYWYMFEDVEKHFNDGTWICLRYERRKKLERISEV